jgi:hypothetical protein
MKDKKPKFYEGPFTPYKSIIEDSGFFELSVIKHDGKWIKEITLCWDPMKLKGDMELWDNSDYVVKLYKQLKNKRKGKSIKAFREMCDKYGLNFDETRASFILMMKEAKIEKMW